MLFVATAVGALGLPAHRVLSLQGLAVSILCYALASRVEFEFGTGWALPTQGVFVAMWFVLPPRMLPLVVCAAMLLGALPDVFRRRLPVERLALTVVSSWHAVGPAIVLFLWGTQQPLWRSVPVYVGALAAQFAFDLAAGFICTHAVIGVSLRTHLHSVLPAYAVDAMLAPFGFLVAFEAYRRPWTLLLVLPVLVMFSTFAK